MFGLIGPVCLGRDATRLTMRPSEEVLGGGGAGEIDIIILA